MRALYETSMYQPRRAPRGARRRLRGMRTKPGFSLVELLVVISILGTLLGLLMPVLSGVRTAGQSVLCQNNLRQMTIAARGYANTYRAYPAALRYDNSDGVFKQIAWDWVTTLSGELISPGALWEFADDPGEVMQCPQYLGKSNAPGDPHTGYNYSPYIGGEEPFSTNPSWSKLRDGASPHQIRRPAHTAMFGLGGYSGGANKYMRSPLHHQHSDIPLQWSGIYSGGQAFRYQGSTFTAYADGHIDSSEQPREGEQATVQLLMQLGYPDNGFLTDDAFAYKP